MFFCHLLILFQDPFEKILSGIPSECQTVWTLIRPLRFVGADLGPNCLPRLTADDTGRQRVEVMFESILKTKSCLGCISMMEQISSSFSICN